MKKALVTGAAGFVGRHMWRHLDDRGYRVFFVDPADGSGEMLELLRQWSHGALTTRFDLVVHCAAAGPHRKAIDTEKGNFPYNVMLDSALFDWAIRTRQRHVVYLSSSAAYPVKYQRDPFTPLWLSEGLIKLDSVDEPDTHYGWTKLTGERMAAAARECGLPVTVVRPFSGYGEDQSENFPFRAFIERAKRREDPFTIWGSGNQVRDWIHIDDVVNGIMALVDADAQSEYNAVNLCTGNGWAMTDLALAMCAAVGYTPRIQIDQSALLGVMNRVGDPVRLRRFYKPRIHVEAGIKRALEWSAK